jgi:mono/diheme cytochrome c family protein
VPHRPRLLAITVVVAFALLLGACIDRSDPLIQGRTIYGDRCSTCHGATGGGGAGPALAGVLTTWPSCADHIEWVTLGSEGWKAAHGETYGATGKPIVGTMPGHADVLTAEQIALVVSFERIRFGGADRAATFAECGVPDPS